MYISEQITKKDVNGPKNAFIPNVAFVLSIYKFSSFVCIACILQRLQYILSTYRSSGTIYPNNACIFVTMAWRKKKKEERLSYMLFFLIEDESSVLVNGTLLTKTFFSL